MATLDSNVSGGVDRPVAGLPGAPVTASGSEPGHPFRGNQWTEISGLDAKKLLKPSEKPGSHDPAKFIKDTDRFKVGKVALSDISKSESGAAYDSTVNMDRAKDYASRQGSFPPILIGEKRVSGLHNVHDGGHRTTAARLRGDTHIAALIKIRSSESNLLSAVRAERLARRVEKVLAASGAFAAGHKFWGNQWSEHAKDAANDPVGEPSGKIKHAVLVIGGKRFKGPSHFQALMVAMDAGHSVDNAEDIQDQGFETESGHFLNRTQAAKYVEKPRTGPGSSQLQSEDLQLVAAGGRLYTQDRVQAISENGSPHAANPLPDVKSVAKAVIRDAGGKVLLIRDAKSGGWDIPGGHLLEGENAATGLMREIYEETGLVPFQSVFRKQQGNAALFDSEVSGNEPHVTLSNEHTEYRWVQEGKAKDLASFWMGGYGDHDAVRAEAQRAVARAVNHVVVLAEAEELSKKRKDDDEFFLLASTIFVAALAEAYGQAARQLVINAAGQDGGESLTQREETEYGASRQKFLENFARDARERIRTEAERGRAQGQADTELVSRVRNEGNAINTGAGKVVAETEAQAIYGHAQLRALRRAGYKTAYWVTVGDERVRDSHTRCEAAGAVRIGDKFPNGLMYPGDPAGGPEEVVNCRCWLEGASRREPAKEAK